MDEDLNQFPPRMTVPNDGKWRTIQIVDGYSVDLECGGDCRIRVMDGDLFLWIGSQGQAQALAGALNTAATVKIG
jgi:hypothetical protein